MDTAGSIQSVKQMVLWGLSLTVVLGVVATAPYVARTFGPGGMAWFLPGISGIVAGGTAVVLRPDSRAGRRITLFGIAGTAFNVLGFWMLAEVGRDPDWTLLGPVAIVVQMLGLAWGAAMVATLAVYPDGRYHRPWEKGLVRALTALVVLVPLAMLIARPTIEPPIFFEWVGPGGEAGAQAIFPSIDSPLHAPGLAWAVPALRAWFGVSFTMVPLAGAVVVALRYRRLRAGGRLQMRWPMYGTLAGLVLGIEGFLWQLTTLPGLLSTVIEIGGLVVIVSSVVIGLVKPNLFDVDRAVLRAVLFFPLWLAIAVFYVGIAAALGLAARGQGLEVAVVVAIAATVSFEPVRRRLAGRAGRWAYGETIDGEELVRRLGATLAHTHDLAALTSGVAATAREGLGVRWVRITVDGATTAVDADGVPGEPELSVALEHGGERLGEMACGPSVRASRRSLDRALFETLAGQVALAVHNARLAGSLTSSLAEIRTQAADLVASRARIVTAQDTARQRLERDLHDGAQQELVALIARIGLAQNQLRRGDPGSVAATLDELAAEAQDALESLRSLAAGIHPAVLTDHGLVAALQSRAGRSPVPVRVRAEPGLGSRRFAEAVEATGYFIACEGIANALKHAQAAEICVNVGLRGDELEIAVVDDGAGFDRAAFARSQDPRGIHGLADRLEALGGTVDVESRPGHGTRLLARLPATEPAGV